MNEFLLILGMMVVTFGVRYPVLAVVGRLNLPQSALRALQFVPVAVLTAIISTSVLLPDGNESPWISLNNAYLIGAIISIIIAWRTRNLLLTIIIGMTIFLLWRNLIG